MKVCILTAGKGSRMGAYSTIINKSLLPVGDKPIITHLIEFFPNDVEFVIALGHMGQQVKDYLLLAHPNKKFYFVNIDNFDGMGSGPGHSLLSCINYLQEPFFYTPCDCILHGELPQVNNQNWIGVDQRPEAESIKFCNVAVKERKVFDIRDKETCNHEYMAFTSPLFVYDYQNFWNSLKNSSLIGGEHQISNGIKGLMKSGLIAIETKWTNLGEFSKYQEIINNENPYDFSKPDELIYFVGSKVIKFFSDVEVVKKRITKSRLKPNVFPEITGIRNNFYSYDFFPGEVFYSSGNPSVFLQLLSWLDENLWTVVPKSNISLLCKEFYYDKTLYRYNLFLKNFPEYSQPQKINDQTIDTLDVLLHKIPWDIITNGKAYFIHGDLNFGNILFDKKRGKFVLIDWRQDFAGETRFGDIYYDLAKLWAGIQINFELIRRGMFELKSDRDNVFFTIPKWKYQSDYANIFDNFLADKKFNKNKVHLLGGLTFINMAPLHKSPFNYLLMAYGNLIINNELKQNIFNN